MVAPGAKKPSSSRLDAAAQEALKARHEALSFVEEQFLDFDVVWAKVHGFPWWPGVLFHSWDVVRRAGIVTDPKIVAELVVPPPEKVPVVDAATGQETGTFRWKRHCLVMFLDKFNFSLVEIKPSNVASYTAHYQLYERAVMGSKNAKKKSEFRRALVKAAKLLHMGKEYVEDDLVLLEEPSPAEKKQRMEEVMELDEDGEGSLEDAWDDRESDSAAFSIEAGEKKPAKTKKASSKKAVRRGKAAEVKDIDDDDVVIMTPAKVRRKAPSKDSKTRTRKPSRKEVQNSHVAVVSPSPSPIDLTNTPESEKKKSHKDKALSGKPPRPRKRKENDDTGTKDSKSKKNGRAKVLVLEDDGDVSEELVEQNSEQVSDEVADITEEEELSNVLLTPLSSIWTSKVPGESSPESEVPVQLTYKQDFVWDDEVFTDELSIAEKEKAEIEQRQAEEAAASAGIGRERSLGKRQSRSIQQSQIRQNLMTGNLDPHTMVQCAAYRPKDYVEDPNSRSRGGPTLDPPFQVVVHPDAVFVADLHAHLATCEIIGFLGGKWDEASKTLYIQAAFPCRSLVIDGDDGSTDVEMDPGSEIELRGIIENAQLEVVGWYHSHPAFAPDPSVRDIENQTSYQQLFQRPNISKEVNGESKISEPFVGLIVGTYDTRRSTPVSLFRYFHTRGEKVSGGARREIYMPYEFIPDRRHFRSVLQDEERERTRLFPMYHSVLQHFKFELVAVKQHQLPTDIKAPLAQKPTLKSSPSRVKAQGPIRKRKQSFDGAGDKPVKKARAKSRRSTRSSSATESCIDLTGDDNSQKLQVSENGSAVAPTSTRETQNGGMDMTAIVAPNGTTVKEEKAAKITVPSTARYTKSNAKASTEKVKPETRDVELQAVKVLADVVMNTEIFNGSDGKLERSRKDQKPKRINENSGENGFKQSRTDNAVMHDPTDATLTQKQQHHAGNKSSNAAKGLKIDSNVAAEATSGNIPQAVSAVKTVALPTTSSTVASRKRGRKPKKTTKNSNWSTSPSSEGPSPRRSPSPTKLQAQTFYDAFSTSGPVVSNGSNHEEVTSPPSRPDCPKPDTLLDDMQYIDVNHESLGMTAPINVGERSVEDNVGMATQHAKTEKHDDLIDQEIRSFVTSVVEQVVKKVASETTSTVKLSAQDSKEAPSLSATLPVVVNGSEDKASVNGFIIVELESESSNPDSAADATVEPPSNIERKQEATVNLFGSNGECEDIQTSLQKMAVYLDILRSSQAAKSSEAETKPQADAVSKAEFNPEVVKSESKQDASQVEQDYLTALRTKYGPGVSGCAEQVITLVDYYRDFERRTDLDEIWKARITKLEKIQSSLSEYVQFLNIPAALRHGFIKDLISYLRESWATKDRRR